LLLASLSILVYRLWARPGAYPTMEHPKGVSFCKLLRFLQTLERLAGMSSLANNNYGRKKVYNIGPWYDPALE